MNPMIRYFVPLLLIFLVQGPIARAQRFDQEDKAAFANTVRKIRVWTYIEGDSSYRRYGDAVLTVKEALNRKGYEVIFEVFERGKGESPQVWMNSIVFKLAEDEAFLRVATQVRMDSVSGPSNDYMKAVAQPSGRVLVLMTRPSITDSGRMMYFSKSSSWLYVKRKDPGSYSLVPVYSRSQNLKSGDLVSVVETTLRGIPASRNPVAGTTTAPAREARIRMEFTFFGGYTLPSQMDIEEGVGLNVTGTARFDGGFQFGVETGFSVSKNFDIFVQYRRLSSAFTMDTPEWSPAGTMTLNQNYILAGTNFNFRICKTWSPYAGITAGTINTVPEGAGLRDYWYFILGAQGGVKAYLSKWFGLRIQADLLYQVHTPEAPFLFTSKPADKSVNAISNMVQAGISAGIILRIGSY
jgi:hypothetical protein